MTTATILVSLDGSKLAEHAIPAAAWLATATGGSVRIVHVLDADDAPKDSDVAAARERFAAYAGGLASKNGLTNATTDVLTGDPATVLLKAASESAYMVMATHGRGGFRATMIGSVTDKVVRGSTVPMLLVPGANAAFEAPSANRPILVGLDGSPEAERGLAVARDLAARGNAAVTLVRAFHIPPPAGVEFAYYPPDILTSLQTAAEEYIRGIAKPGEGERLIQGDAATAVLDTAKAVNAGLVVLTASGKGLAKRVAFGSVTDRVLHAIDRPLMVIPPKR